MNPIKEVYFLDSFAHGVAVLLNLDLGPLAHTVKLVY